MKMTPRDYQIWTASTVSDTIDPDDIYEYLLAGELSEVGEIAALCKRELRDQAEIDRATLIRELGDLAWYWARLAAENGVEWPDQYVRKGTSLLLTDAIRSRYHALHGSDYHYAFIYLCQICYVAGVDVAEVFAVNVAKLEARKAKGMITGKGGDREL